MSRDWKASERGALSNSCFASCRWCRFVDPSTCMLRYEQQLQRLFLSHSFELQCWGSATLGRRGKPASRNLSNSLSGVLNIELIMSECNMVYGCIALHMWYYASTFLFSIVRPFLETIIIICLPAWCYIFWLRLHLVDIEIVMISLSFRIGVNLENRGTIVVLESYGLALCVLDVFWMVVL